MRFTFASLSTWEGCASVASSLHDHDGYPSSSPLPTPQVDRCLSPCPVCVDSGWLYGSACTAPAGYVPDVYITEASTVCPARKHNAMVGLDAQESESLGQTIDLMDAETLLVMRWIKNMLAVIAVGQMSAEVRDYAARLLRDAVQPVGIDTVEALGRELHTRFERRCSYKKEASGA